MFGKKQEQNPEELQQDLHKLQQAIEQADKCYRGSMFDAAASLAGVGTRGRQQLLAQKLEIPPAMLSNIKNGRAPLSVKMAVRLQLLTGIPAVAWLLPRLLDKIREELQPYEDKAG